jgi:hypothetical protein
MYVLRTTLLLPENLKVASEIYARSKRISLGALIRTQLAAVVDASGHDSRREDPLFASFAPFEGPMPSDLALNHDAALYDEGALSKSGTRKAVKSPASKSERRRKRNVKK